MQGCINYNKPYYCGSWPHSLLRGPLALANSLSIIPRNFQRLSHGCLLTHPVSYHLELAASFLLLQPSFMRPPTVLCPGPPPVRSRPQGSLSTKCLADCRSKQKLEHHPPASLHPGLTVFQWNSSSPSCVQPPDSHRSLHRSSSCSSSMPPSFASFTYPQEF